MSTREDELVRFLRLLDRLGCLEHVVLIGSWAEVIYQSTDLLQDFAANIRTLDIDFLVRNIRRPIPAVSLAAAARQEGYLVESDFLDGATKIYDPKGLEVEFLMAKRGAGVEPSAKTNLGITAQTLWHLDILLNNTMTVSYHNLNVLVPTPEAYALHKMVINHKRKSKAEKDAQAIRALWPHLNAQTLSDVFEGLSKKEQANVRTFLNEHELSMP